MAVGRANYLCGGTCRNGHAAEWNIGPGNSGPPLVLVHGGFSDHETNWEFVKPLFEKQFTSMPSPAAAGVKRMRPKVTASRMRARMSWR